MQTLCHLVRFVFFCALFANAPTRLGATSVVPDERDRQVLETLLLHLLADPASDLARVSTYGETIALNIRTPEKTGMIRPEQMKQDIDIGKGHTIPGDVQKDLLRRNEKPCTSDSQMASFADLKFDRRVEVANVFVILEGRKSYRAFQEAHPKARAWVQAWLPGYSKDRKIALVRAWVGPSDHGAVVTAFLEKHGDQWRVKWHYLARFL